MQGLNQSNSHKGLHSTPPQGPSFTIISTMLQYRKTFAIAKGRNQMKIKEIEIYAIQLPLHEPFIVSYASYDSIPSIIIKLTTDTV